MKNKKALVQKEKTKFREVLPYLIVMAISLFILVVLIALRTSTEVCEFMTKNVSGNINFVANKVASVFPFSLFEAFVITCIVILVALIVLLIVLLVKKRFMLVVKSVVLIGSICVLFGSYYVLVAGFAYNRNPVEPFYPESVEYYEFYKIVKYYKEDFDYLSEKLSRDENGMTICPYTNEELNVILKNECQRLDSSYYNVKACFNVKPLKVLSGFFSSNGISGITFTPSGDSGYVKDQPSVEITYTALHEMMHSIGVMRENEANAVSCYLLISSENEYLRYAGYFGYYRYLLNALSLNYDKDEYSQVLVNAKVSKETAQMNDYWASQSSLFEKVGDFFNNLYLKLSGEKNGTDSYREPSVSSGVEKVEGDRVFVEVKYNSFQQAFIRAYYDKNGK